MNLSSSFCSSDSLGLRACESSGNVFFCETKNELEEGEGGFECFDSDDNCDGLEFVVEENDGDDDDDEVTIRGERNFLRIILSFF